MLDILAIQTSSHQTGTNAQTRKKETADGKEHAFAEEYDAASGDRDDIEPQKADEAKAASDEATANDDAEASAEDETPTDAAGTSETAGSGTETEKQPAFGLVEGAKQPTMPSDETSRAAVEIGREKHTNAIDTLQAKMLGKDATDTSKTAEGVAGTKSGASTISTAEVIFTAKAVENATAQRAAGAIERPAKAVAADLQAMATPVVKQESKQTAPPSVSVKGDQLSEKLKADMIGEELRQRAPTLRSETASQSIAPSATSAQQAVNVTPLTTLAKGEAGKEKATLDPIGALNFEALASGESRGTSSTATTSLNQLLGRAETPAAIARQMAEALQKLPDRPVEISLNPKELGRVRMNISAADAGVTVTIVTERPETLDLMRRNIDQLVREFQAIGYNDINFAFAEGEAQQSFADDGESGDGAPSTQLELLEAEDTEIENEKNMYAHSGVDIRL